MPEATRPSPVRKVTRTTEKSRQDTLDQGVKLCIDGEEYVVRIGDVTPALARQFRREVGMPFSDLIAEFSDKPDIDSLAALIWMAQLIRGEDAALEDVAIGYADVDRLEVSEPGAAEDDGHPEA